MASGGVLTQILLLSAWLLASSAHSLSLESALSGISPAQDTTHRGDDISIREAELNLRRGNYAATARICRTILKSNPVEADALLLLGKASFSAAEKLAGTPPAQQAYAEAEQSFLRFLKVDPDRSETRIWQSLAICASRRDAHSVALQRARKSVEVEPNNPLALRILGESARALGRNEEALDSFQKSHNIRPGDLDVVHLLALALKKLDRPAAARQLLETTIAGLPPRSPGTVQLSLVLFTVHLNTNQPQLAQTVLEQAALIAPENLTLNVEMCANLYRLGDHSRARFYAEKARGLIGQSRISRAITARVLGQIHAHQGNHAEAIVELKRAIERQPDDLASLQSLAGSLRRSGEEQEARGVLERYRKIRQQISLVEAKPAPDLAQAEGLERQAQIIRALVDLGRFDQAKQQLSRRLAASPNHPSNSILQELLEQQEPR